MDNTSPAPRNDRDAPGDEQASGYAGPPGNYEPALDELTRRRKRLGQILSAAGSIAHILGSAVADHYGRESAELVEQAHRDGHRQGWYERGEELTPAELGELQPVDESQPFGGLAPRFANPEPVDELQGDGAQA